MAVNLNKIQVIVFDIGSTLMQFNGMPMNWCSFYSDALAKVNDDLNLNITAEDIELSVSLMTSLNPRVTNSENEIYPYDVFKKITEHWLICVDIDMLIERFFDCMNLSPVVFDYTFDLIDTIKKQGKTVGLLTDLPNGMPDDYFKKYVSDIISRCDFYISSQTFGYRKPNPYSLNRIAERYSATKEQILYVGDEEKDSATAKRFGCEFMYINDFVNLVQF